MLRLAKEKHKIDWSPDDVKTFWSHWENHFEVSHPATSEKVHLPIGLSGDDARYTLAGAKIIVMMLNFLLQRTMRHFGIAV